MKLTSWNDFRRTFGGFLPYSYLAYSVRGFFATGGETCYVVRVGAAGTPPTTALMPLPASITSKLVASLDMNAAAGATQIHVDSPVALPIGSSIAIGDPAFSQRLIVTGMVDSQTILISDATQTGAGLELAQAAGTLVFALSGPAVAHQITSVAAATSAGASRIKVGSSDVIGFAQGSLIAIGDPIAGECVSVASIVDDQNIAVQPQLLSAHAAGDPVYPIPGSALVAPAAAGATCLHVADASVFVQDDLIVIEGGGVTEVRVVTAPPAGSAIQIGLALGFGYNSGAVVRKSTAALAVKAASPGAWGNRIRLEILPLDPGNAITHFSMRVTVDQGSDPAQPPQQEFYPLLSLDPYDPYPQAADVRGASSRSQVSSIYAPQVVNDASELIQLTPLLPQTLEQGTRLLVGSEPVQTTDLYLEGGSDGTPKTVTPVAAAPVSNPCKFQTSVPPAVAPAQPYPSPPNATNQDFQDALDVLGLVGEIAILCCPEAGGPPPQTIAANGWDMQTIQQAMIAQCVRLQYRVALLDTPRSQDSGGSLRPSAALSWLSEQGYSEPDARFGAVYYPWLMVPDELSIEGPNRTVPPCGHVAGAYAYTDSQSGVQKPPANVELQFISDVQVAVTNAQQGLLNPAGINVIRPFAGRGIRVWGARSISRDPNWIYIHTRRLMSMIEDSVEQATRWVVFRTNDDDLRRMVTHSLNVFLRSIWLTGGLKGAGATDSYFVKCDGTNNTQNSIDAGQLICQVGVAIAAPMEFLVFDVRRSVAGAQVVEA